MIKNIIFDWSGVVKDSVSTHLFVVNKIFKKFGVKEITLEELKENWQQPHMIFYNKYLPSSATKEQVDEYYKQIVPDAPKAKEYPCMVNLVKKLKKVGKKIFVLSSDYQETLFPEIEEFGLKNIFDNVYPNVHDKREVMNGLMEKNYLDKKDTVIIGDTTHEIEAGNESGVKTIAVTWGYGVEAKLKAENPDFMVHNVEELEKILL